MAYAHKQFFASLFLTAAVAILPAHGNGYFLSGNKALELCSADPNFCEGLVMAFNDASTFYNHSLWNRVCMPEAATSTQIKDVYLLFLKEHPADRHDSAISQFIRALIDSFPC